ncbi:MAG: hypothetical protein ACQERB_15620, partial [Promethearchaeati archaeon]
NSSLYNYLAKGIINNTNSIQLTGIHSLPIILPGHNVKIKVEERVKKVIHQLKKNSSYDYSKEQRELDRIIYNFHAEKFNFPPSLKQKLDKIYSIYAD